jgi:chorismate-pyruvate lyase
MPAARPRRPVRRVPAEAGRILFPLDLAYARAGLAPPRARAIAPVRIPAPYAALLQHDGDMTGALERYHRQRLIVRTLSSTVRGRWYARRVLLARADSGQPVAMGAIRVRLDAFRTRVRSQILASDKPFGRVLRQNALDYRSRPRVFLALVPNAEMLGVFWMPRARTLYGRQTDLLVAGEPVGHVVEVLPRT